MQILRQRKGCGVDRRVVVPTLESGLVEAGLHDLGREMAQNVVIRRPGKGHDPAVVSGDRRLVEADVSKIGAQLTVAIKCFILLQEANTVLRHKIPPGFRHRLQPS